MSKRVTRILNRKINLERLADAGELFCTRHKVNGYNLQLTPQIIRDKKCYIGNHGKGVCKYLNGYR